jgi:hypothetical protein
VHSYTSGPGAGLPEVSRGDDDDGNDDGDGDRAAAGCGAREFTPVWCRDSRGGAVVVPRAQEGALRDHEPSLIMLGEDWYILGLRFEVDIEAGLSLPLPGVRVVAWTSATIP